MTAHNTKARAEALLDAALDIVTADVQAELDDLTVEAANERRRQLQRQLRDATDCSWYLSRQYVDQALRRRRGQRIDLPRQGGFRPENAGDNQWKRRRKAAMSAADELTHFGQDDPTGGEP